MKCEFCSGTSWRTNERNGVECSGCGAPQPDIHLFEAAPFYVMTVQKSLRDVDYQRIKELWESMFIGVTQVPKILILEEGTTIAPLASK